LHNWLREVADEINRLPPQSTFSVAIAATPESTISGNPGEVVFNQAAPSTSTARMWVKMSGIGNTGWVSMATVQ